MLALLGTDAGAAVEASQYRQFWLWAGVRPQPVLQQAERLYLHQGEIGPLDSALPLRFQGQGIAPSKLPVGELWLAYRVERLDWDDILLQNLENQLAAWQRKGNEVRGIQIDFDARTHRLADGLHLPAAESSRASGRGYHGGRTEPRKATPCRKRSIGLANSGPA